MNVRHRVLLSLVLTFGAQTSSADVVTTYDEALHSAATTDGIAVIDFFTTWCGPCKSFEKDLEPDAALAEFAEGITLLRIDAEDPAWAELTLRFDIHSFPTFVAVDAAGEERYRWIGYDGADHFIAEYDIARSNPLSIEERIRAFETEPTADAASEIADFLARGRRYAESAEFQEWVAVLDHERAAEARWEAFAASRASCDFFLQIPWPVMDRRAQAVLADPDVDGGRIIRVALGMRAAAKLESDLRRYLPYLEPALSVEPNPEDQHAEFHRSTLEWDRRILVEGDVTGAIRARRAELPEGWESNVYEVIGYTMWCAEHRVDLEFARHIVETALEQGIAPDTQGKAFLWSNLADIHFAAGEYEQAAAAQRRCIELVPQYSVFRLALEFFEEQAAGGS